MTGPRLALLPLLLVSCARDAGPVVATPPPAPVVVGTVLRRDVPVTIRSIGNVAADSSVEVRSQVEGPVLSVGFEDGSLVRKGQALFTIDPEPYRIVVEQMDAQLARDRALLTKAESDAARYAKLVEKEYVTREQSEGAEANAASLRATIRADEAALAAARLDLARCTIVAPIAGRAGTIAVDPGNLVRAGGDPLVTILSTRPVRVAFSVPEKHLAEVRLRSGKETLPVRALAPGESGDGHAGTLTFIDNAVDRTTGTVRMEATFPNDGDTLWPGQFVELDLRVALQHDAVVAPTTAIQVGQQGSFVFVVGQDGVAEVRPVVVDRAVGEESVISQGLSGGETVVTDGQIRVVPGAKVAIRNASGEKPS